MLGGRMLGAAPARQREIPLVSALSMPWTPAEPMITQDCNDGTCRPGGHSG